MEDIESYIEYATEEELLTHLDELLSYEKPEVLADLAFKHNRLYLLNQFIDDLEDDEILDFMHYWLLDENYSALKFFSNKFRDIVSTSDPVLVKMAKRSIRMKNFLWEKFPEYAVNIFDLNQVDITRLSPRAANIVLERLIDEGQFTKVKRLLPLIPFDFSVAKDIMEANIFTSEELLQMPNIPDIVFTRLLNDTLKEILKTKKRKIKDFLFLEDVNLPGIITDCNLKETILIILSIAPPYMFYGEESYYMKLYKLLFPFIERFDSFQGFEYLIERWLDIIEDIYEDDNFKIYMLLTKEISELTGVRVNKNLRKPYKYIWGDE